MPTSSFDQQFVISDPVVIAQLEYDLELPEPCIYTKHDLKADQELGLKLLGEAFGVSPLPLSLGDERCHR